MDFQAFVKRTLRYYLYSRRGLSHIGVALSFFNFINILYLISREWVVLQNLRYTYIALLTIAVLAPILVVVGYLDYKKGFFAIESVISTEQNPYCDEAFMEKERKYLLPITIIGTRLSLKVNELLLRKVGIDDPEAGELIEELRECLNRLEIKLNEDKDVLKDASPSSRQRTAHARGSG